MGAVVAYVSHQVGSCMYCFDVKYSGDEAFPRDMLLFDVKELASEEIEQRTKRLSDSRKKIKIGLAGHPDCFVGSWCN